MSMQYKINSGNSFKISYGNIIVSPIFFFFFLKSSEMKSVESLCGAKQEYKISHNLKILFYCKKKKKFFKYKNHPSVLIFAMVVIHPKVNNLINSCKTLTTWNINGSFSNHFRRVVGSPSEVIP